MELTDKVKTFFGTLESKLIRLSLGTSTTSLLGYDAILNFSEKDYKLAIVETLMTLYFGWTTYKDGKKIAKEYKK